MPEESRSLDCVFRPRSIAVIGASRRPGSIGREMLRNLLAYEFNGKVFPVNPHAEVISSMKVYRTVLQIHDDIDLAIVVVPQEHVYHALEDCGRRGVKGVVVISAGFREVGAEGLEREQRLIDLCERYGMRMVGPNCMGIVNTHPDISMNATFAPSQPLRGNIAFLSQSGAMGVAILEHAQALNLGYSMFISMGNKADVDTIDLLEYWEDDPETDLILMYLESFGEPREFTALARRIVRKKPVICVKSGRTLAGARAASSHTGALAGLDMAADALFEQTGILRVDTVEGLFEVAQAFATQPIPKGDRVAILTDAGGRPLLDWDCTNLRDTLWKRLDTFMMLQIFATFALPAWGTLLLIPSFDIPPGSCASLPYPFCELLFVQWRVDEAFWCDGALLEYAKIIDHPHLALWQCVNGPLPCICDPIRVIR